MGSHDAAPIGVRRGRHPGAPPTPFSRHRTPHGGSSDDGQGRGEAAGAASVSGTSACAKSGSQRGCAPSAEPPRPSPSAGSAPSATGSGARRTGPDMPGPRPPARFPAANAQRPSAAARAPAARGATTSAYPLAHASDAACAHLQKGAAAASPAAPGATAGSARCGPSAAPRARVARAAIPRRMAPRAAWPAPRSRPAGRRAGIMRGSCTSGGASGICAPIAVPRQAMRHGASPCARRSYARSPEHRGLPVWPARFTVIEIDTGVCHGSFDSGGGGRSPSGVREARARSVGDRL